MTRTDIDDLLWDKLPQWMTEEQRKNKVMNLIMELKRNNKILNKGTRSIPKWKTIKVTYERIYERKKVTY